MSKYLAALALSAATLDVPGLSFAQSSAPVTRAEVRADLVRLEQAGYMPGANDNYYPRDIQTAEARIAARDERPLVNQSTGGVSQSSGTASGGPSHTAMHCNCVGPASFCQVFFGS